MERREGELGRRGGGGRAESFEPSRQPCKEKDKFIGRIWIHVEPNRSGGGISVLLKLLRRRKKENETKRACSFSSMAS